MTNDFEKVFDTAAEPEDYTGEDGLLQRIMPEMPAWVQAELPGGCD